MTFLKFPEYKSFETAWNISKEYLTSHKTWNFKPMQTEKTKTFALKK